MEQRLQYEQTIAGKLQSLPIPDMQDAIWERVKLQLDLDMPEDDDPGSTPPPTKGPGLTGWGLPVLLVVFIAVFIIFKNKPSQTSTNNNTPTNSQTPAPDQTSNAPPGTVNTNDPKSGNKSINNAVSLPTFMQPGVQDSSVQDGALVTLPPLPDSAIAKPVQDNAVVQRAADTIPLTNKRQRGVTGLSPDDFRIVPKKDSSKRQ